MKVVITIEDGDEPQEAYFIAGTVQGLRDAKKIGENLKVLVDMPGKPG